MLSFRYRFSRVIRKLREPIDADELPNDTMLSVQNAVFFRHLVVFEEALKPQFLGQSSREASSRINFRSTKPQHRRLANEYTAYVPWSRRRERNLVKVEYFGVFRPTFMPQVYTTRYYLDKTDVRNNQTSAWRTTAMNNVSSSTPAISNTRSRRVFNGSRRNTWRSDLSTIFSKFFPLHLIFPPFFSFQKYFTTRFRYSSRYDELSERLTSGLTKF